MKQILTVFLALVPLSFVFGADSSGGSAGVSPYAYEIGKLFNLPLTNAILTTWVVSIIFILTVRFAVGKPSLIPNKAQLVVETLIDGLKGLLEPILGKRLSASFSAASRLFRLHSDPQLEWLVAWNRRIWLLRCGWTPELLVASSQLRSQCRFRLGADCHDCVGLFDDQGFGY